MNPATETCDYEFDGFRLSAAKRQLLGRDGEPIQLPSRAFDVLLFMVERPGEMLGKPALMEAVWPQSVVEESNLTQCVFTLRRALGDTASEHRYIATAPGRGYQFVAKVQSHRRVDALALQPTEPGSAPAATARPRRRLAALVTTAALALTALLSIVLWPHSEKPAAEIPIQAREAQKSTVAVLPFIDLSQGQDMEYFAEGMAEEIMNSLAGNGSLQVIGRRSVHAIKDLNLDTRAIGEKLGVDNILEGSVRRSGDRLRITAQLVRSRDGVNLWSKAFDRKLDDILDIQDAIAKDVTAALSPVLSDTNTGGGNVHAARPANADAYTAYLRGLSLFRRGRPQADLESRAEFEQVIKLDPDFALGHAWLARTRALIARQSIDDVARNRAASNASLKRALELDPSLADLWWIRAWAGNLEAIPLALRTAQFERALAASPGDAEVMAYLSFNYLRLGRRAESVSLDERARITEPLLPVAVLGDAYSSYMYRVDRRRADDLIARVEEFAPEDPRAAGLRAHMAFNEGRALDWDRWNTKALELSPDEVVRHGFLSIDYAELGLRDAAMHHAPLTSSLVSGSAGASYNVSHAYLFTGAVDAAGPIVKDSLERFPADFLTHSAQSELAYFTGDCPLAVQAGLRARPVYAEPIGTVDFMTDPDGAPILVWCLRQTGNIIRANELYEEFRRQLAPPTAPGAVEGLRSRMAAAAGDREMLLAQLSALVESNSMGFAFVRHEPMIQPYLNDPQIAKLLAVLDARRAEWRRILPKSSMRVPNPGVMPGAATN